MHPTSPTTDCSCCAKRPKADLFDTSVLESPQSRGTITLDGPGSDSEVLYDRHAFTFLAGANSDRLAVPANIHTGLPENGGVTTALHQFEILGKSSASSASLHEAGIISPPDPEPWEGFSRAFISGEAVYYIRHVGHVLDGTFAVERSVLNAALHAQSIRSVRSRKSASRPRGSSRHAARACERPS
jgi:hypothetical protein